MRETAGELVAGRTLAANVGRSTLAWLVPAAVALVALPVLSARLGPDRFGLLALAWGLLSGLAHFDAGVGRAVTQRVAERLGANDPDAARDATIAGSSLLAPLALLTGVVLLLAAPFVALRWLGVPPHLHGEALGTITVIALVTPALMHAAVPAGVLEALQRFRVLAWLRVPMGITTFGGPLVASFFTTDVGTLVLVAALGRVAYWLGAMIVANALVPGLWQWTRTPWTRDPQLMRTGKWLTVSAFANPVLVSSDRLLLGLVAPIAAVGWYGVASEAATKLWLLSGALQPVLFPALATAWTADRARAARIYDRGIRYTLLCVAPPAIVLCGAGPELLHLWMGADFARESATALQVITAGVFANTLAQMPAAFLQGTGRARFVALAQSVEVPLFVAAFLLLSARYGAVGAAIAWSGRMIVDTVVMFSGARHTPELRGAVPRRIAWLVWALTAILLVPAFTTSLAARAAAAAVALVAWASLLGALVPPVERAAIRSWFRRGPPRA